MKKNEEIKDDKRKESVSSSKSEEVSGSDDNEDIYIPIKKEKSNYQIIDNKLFDKIVQHIKNINSFQEQIKSRQISPKINTSQNFDQNKFTKILTNEFSIINNINNINNIASTKKIQTQNNEKEEETLNSNLYKSSDNIIKIPNPNPNTSMMNLFLNANKSKEKEKEEITKLKSELADITKKYQTEIDNYKIVVNDLTSKIGNLEKELNKLKEINTKLISRQNLNKTSFELIYTNEKILKKILSYLETQEKFNFSKTNIFLYKNIFFKAVSENLLKTVKHKNYIIEKLSGEDLLDKFDVKEPEISQLFNEYILNQKISGINMRNEIVKSLIFLENYVNIPLANYKLSISSGNKINENMFNLPQEKQDNNKKPKFFSKFFSALKSEIKEEIGIGPKSEIILKNNYISFTPNEYMNIFDTDSHVLQTSKTDKSLNVKFVYESPDKIKQILNDFFISQLPQQTYQKFITKICETFSELLFASFLALNDIKNLEIIEYALYIRYMKYKIKIEDLQGVIDDLNHFAESSRQIKEMMTKAKNELEFKYTNSVMTVSQLSNSVNKKEEEIIKLKSEIKEKDEKYDKFKNDIIKEYKVIKDEFTFTKKERDTIKGILLEFKEYFIKVVTGELLK